MAALLLVLAACDDDAAPADPCAQRLDALETRLSARAAEAEPAGAPLEVPLPRVERGAPLGEGLPLLVVSADEVRLGERAVGGGDDLERLARTLASDLRGLEAATEGEDLRRVALWVDPAVEVHRLARILSQAPDDVRFVLLVRGPARPPPEAPPWVEEALTPPPLPVVEEDRPEGVFAREDNPDDPFARRRRIERAWARATESCSAARGHLPSVAALDHAGPPLGPPSVAPLVGALRECGCGADLDAIEALVHAAVVSPEGPVWRATPLLRFGLPSGDGVELQLGDADVARLATRVAREDADVVWIRAD